MGLNDIIEKVTDPYERQARLYPALLALVPLFVLLASLYTAKVSSITNIVMILTSCGGLYLMTNVSRKSGARLEPKLYEIWGGKPTTQLLRHRDKTIDGVTKRRYHAFLSGKINVRFLTTEQEASHPAEADDLYQSAVKWLLNQTRDTKKFALLFKENIAYGFHRNALGLKPIGLLVSFGSLSWVLLSQKVITFSAKQYLDVNALIALPENAILSLVASVAMITVWLLYLTKASARNAAIIYAEMLLRACDSL